MAEIDINNEEQYKIAAERLKNYISDTDFKFSNKEEIDKKYNDFRNDYSPEKLKEIPDDKLLDGLFSLNPKNKSLCYSLEYGYKFLGGLINGYIFKYPLFTRNGKWCEGNPKEIKELTLEQAINKAKSIRDSLIKVYKYIKESNFENLDDYRNFEIEMGDELIKFVKPIWVRKYFHMIFPSIFNDFHKDELQSHILYGLGVVPGNTYYERCGQLVKINRIIGCLPHDFSRACLNKLGDKIKSFYRLGSTDGTGKKYANEWQKDEIVAIGWSKLGSLRHYVNSENKINTDLLKNKLMEIKYNGNKSISSRKANEIKNFYESDKNTIFVVADGEKIIGLVDDIGEYNFEKKDHMAHSKKCNWAIVFQENTKLPKEDEGNQRTCSEVKDTKNLLFLYNIYYWSERKLPNKTISSSNKHYNSLNTILYGPPGTGKTYNTVINAMEIIKGNSYDKIKEGYLKEYNKEKDDDFDFYCYKRIKEEFKKAKKAGRIEFITFHQSYAYEEFVEGIKPDLGEVWGKSTDRLTYKGSDGIFKIICKEASRNKDKKYVLIIDEINRGNISKIFGELITLIEEDKRESFTVRLPYSHEEFTVPKNLYIIGTMNTSDRSIASIDIALRRRFTFKEMMPDSELVADFEIGFKNIFEELNNRIRILLDRDHQIGHSYFIKTNYNNENNNNNIKTLKEIWFNSIMPLLNEYFYNDWEKLRALLGDAKDPVVNENKKIWSSFIKNTEETTFAIDYEIDKEEQYDFVSDTEIDFEEALNHAFSKKSS